MKSLLRSWRVLWLALTIAVAPQITLVHALSHVSTATQSGEERQQAPEKGCDTCVLLAHLGQALTTQYSWAAPATGMAVPAAVAVTQIALRAPAHFQARAPPISL